LGSRLLSTQGKTSYVESIDGLRAVAVILVLLFHAGFSWAEGGFIGVDVFFVISGFLITGQTLKSAETGTWSVKRFYSRRIQRLLPSLFTVVLATLIAGWFILSETDLRNLAHSAISSVLMIPNIGFWLESGYFDQAASTKPLLHTWSLGVEEQFYLLWPFVILELARLGRPKLIVGCVIIGAVSFIAAYLVFPQDPSAVFFLAPYRVFQFAIGAGLSAAMSPSASRVGAPLGMLAIMGLLGLGVTLKGNEDVVISMLAPALLTGVFIAFGRAPVITHIFASAPLVWIGQRSYAIYLVHWPMMVLWLIATDYRFTMPEAVLACLLSIGLGATLHTLVETPLRITDRDTMIKTPTKFLATGLLLFLILGTSALIYSGPAPEEISSMEAEAAKIALVPSTAASESDIPKKRCFMMKDTPLEEYGLEECAKFTGERPSYLIVGDSFAGDIYVALSVAYKGEADIGYFVAPGCRLMSPSKMASDARTHCQRLFHYALNDVVAAKNPTGIILTSEWSTVPDSDVLDLIEFLSARGLKVYVVGTRPVFADDVPKIVSGFDDLSQAAARVNEIVKPGLKERDEALKAAVGERATYIHLYPMLCEPTCRITTDKGAPVYRDYLHFSLEGSTWVGRKIKDTLMLQDPTIPLE